jgi:hypothetical protein
MKTKQFINSSNFIKTALTSNHLTQLLAVSTMAIGATVGISAAPAGAVLLNNGNLALSDGTSDFYTAGNPSSYAVNFNPTGKVLASGVTNTFLTAFTPDSIVSVNANSPATFNLVSGTTNNFSLASALDFNFTNGVKISVDGGSIFTRNINNGSVGVAFSNSNVTGKVVNADGTVNLQALSFSFNDNPNVGGGSYSLTLSPTLGAAASVPEPFTIIGTLIGGTAAFRMRKKLGNASKN